MLRIQNTYENEIVIEKSRFITRIFRVNDIDMVNSILEEIRKKHYDATHNCYAYILGDNQEIQKCSDDGEPQKTAGFPMMDVLKKNNLTNVLVIVTRYFGGILLGAGGLVRAYSDSVAQVLKKCEFYDIKKVVKFSFTTSYSGYNSILKTIPYLIIDNTSFTSDVIITGYCDLDRYDKLTEDLYKYKIEANGLMNLGEEYIEYKKEA